MKRAAVAGAVILIVVAVAVLAMGNRSDKVVAGGPPTARLISQDQFANTIAALFGADVLPSAKFPPVKRTEGLVALGSSTAVVTPGAFEQFDGTARAIAAKVVDADHRQFLIGCTAEEERVKDLRCAERFFARAGRSLYRRPLTQEELRFYVSGAREATDRIGNFYEGIAYALGGMLTSPKVLLVVETAEKNARIGAEVLNAYSKASRLSLLLWNAFPDDALLTAAEKGELDTHKGLARQVDRMLASPRVEASIRAFFKDWMKFDAFETLAKDPVIYPAFTRRVAVEAEEQTLLTIVNHIQKDRDYRDLFTTRDTYINGGIGPIYKASVQRPDTWTSYELPADSPRAGILTLPSFLALFSHPGRSSATLRGRALREIFLCQQVPDPPPNVDFSIVEDPKHSRKTARERVAAHLMDPVCAGCHKITDPIGLALENFDGAGQYREVENGVAIDASGSLGSVAFKNAVELGKAVRDDPDTSRCLVNRLYSYGVGRPVDRLDVPAMEELGKGFAEDGYRVKGLLRTIALSDSFFAVMRREPSEQRQAELTK